MCNTVNKFVKQGAVVVRFQHFATTRRVWFLSFTARFHSVILSRGYLSRSIYEKNHYYSRFYLSRLRDRIYPIDYGRFLSIVLNCFYVGYSWIRSVISHDLPLRHTAVRCSTYLKVQYLLPNESNFYLIILTL